MRSPITNSGCVKSQCAETSTARRDDGGDSETSVRGTPRELPPFVYPSACQPHARRPLRFAGIFVGIVNAAPAVIFSVAQRTPGRRRVESSAVTASWGGGQRGDGLAQRVRVGDRLSAQRFGDRQALTAARGAGRVWGATLHGDGAGLRRCGSGRLAGVVGRTVALMIVRRVLGVPGCGPTPDADAMEIVVGTPP